MRTQLSTYERGKRRREYYRKYRLKNRERLLAARKKWAIENKESLRLKALDYRAREKEKVKEINRRYYAKKKALKKREHEKWVRRMGLHDKQREVEMLWKATQPC